MSRRRDQGEASGTDAAREASGAHPEGTASSGPERTVDGHHVVVNGRRWRATDPGIPETLRQELVAELMGARRAVRSEGRGARQRVQDAKVALGERGEPWWEPPTEEGLRAREQATIRALLRHRAGKTICPSDVARALGGEQWRELMDGVRETARALADVGEITVRQKGEKVDLTTARGPVRLAPGPALKGLPEPGR